MALWGGSEHECRREKPLPAFSCNLGESCAACVLVQHRLKPWLQACLRSSQGNVWSQAAQHLHPACPAIEHAVEAGKGLRRHGGRNPERRNLANVDASELRGRDADHYHRMPIHEHLSAHHVRSAGKLRFPEIVRGFAPNPSILMRAAIYKARASTL